LDDAIESDNKTFTAVHEPGGHVVFSILNSRCSKMAGQ
jgi:hypothetical protein